MRAAGPWPGLALAIVLSACARQQAPPGGEQDRLPPVVVAVEPEALSTVEEGGDRIRVVFNERISERPAQGTLDDLVTVSPRTGDVRVRHGRSGLDVEVVGGFQPGVVYRVTVRPLVRDMFGNTMREPFEFGFSTGGEFHETALAGLVVDRLTGRPLPDLVVRFDRQDVADPAPHWTRTDSGVYAVRWLPPGAYEVVAFQDRNRDFLTDPLEVQGRRQITLGAADTLFLDFPVQEPDTTAARLTRAEVVAASTVRLTFDDYLDPDVSLARVGAVIAPQEGGAGAPDVRQLLHEHRWVALRAAADSLRAAEDSAAAADTLAAPDTLAVDPPVVDTIVADTVVADTTGTRAGAPPARAPTGYQGRAQGADSAAAALLGLTLPSRVIYVELADSLPYEVGWVLRIEGVVNLAGLASPIDSVRFQREAPPAPPPPPPGAGPGGTPADPSPAGEGDGVAAAHPAAAARLGRP